MRLLGALRLPVDPPRDQGSTWHDKGVQCHGVRRRVLGRIILVRQLGLDFRALVVRLAFLIYCVCVAVPVRPPYNRLLLYQGMRGHNNRVFDTAEPKAFYCTPIYNLLIE